MITYIYSWIKNIAFYLILITAIMNVLPGNSYKKYIRLFTGMLLIILVLGPINQLFNADTRIDATFLKNLYTNEILNSSSEIMNSQESSENSLFDQYEIQIETSIEDKIKESGYKYVKVEVIMQRDSESDNYGDITSVDVTVSDTENKIYINEIEIDVSDDEIDSVEEINIKNQIEDFYNIPYDNINVNIQR